MYGDGLNIREWLYVDDHVDALIQVANKGLLGSSYCIGSSEEFTNLDVLLLICEYLDEYRPTHGPHKHLISSVKDRTGHDWRYSIDSSLIRKQLQWKPSHSFSEGLKLTVSWFLDNMDWCK